MVVPTVQSPEVVSAEGVPSYEGDASQAGQPGMGSPFDAAGGPPQGTIPAYNPYGRRPDSPFMPSISPHRFSIGEAWSDAWAVFTFRYWPIVGVSILAMVINGGAGMSERIVSNVTVLLLGEVSFLAYVVVLIASKIFQAWINIGLCIYLLNMVADRNPSINNLFAGGRYLLRYIGAAILFSCGMIAIAVVFALPVLGVFIAGGNQFNQQDFKNASQTFWIISGSIAGVGIFCLMYYALTFTLWPLLLIDRNVGVIESLSSSAKLMRGNRIHYFLIQLITSFAVGVVVLLTCGIGIIFAVPFMALLGVILYYHIAGLPIGHIYQEF